MMLKREKGVNDNEYKGREFLFLLFSQSGEKVWQLVDFFFFFFDFLYDHHARNFCTDFPSARKCMKKFPQHIISIWTNLQSHGSSIVRILHSHCAMCRVESSKDEEMFHNISAFNIESMEHFHSREFFFFRIGCNSSSEGGGGTKGKTFCFLL